MGYWFWAYLPPYDVHVRELSFWKTDWHISIYITVTYSTRSNHQRCFRLSNWFVVLCLGSWMNQSPPIWWSTLKFIFLSDTWCVNLIWWKGFDIDVLLWCFVMTQTRIICITRTNIKCGISNLPPIMCTVYPLICARICLWYWISCT